MIWHYRVLALGWVLCTYTVSHWFSHVILITYYFPRKEKLFEMVTLLLGAESCSSPSQPHAPPALSSETQTQSDRLAIPQWTGMELKHSSSSYHVALACQIATLSFWPGIESNFKMAKVQHWISLCHYFGLTIPFSDEAQTHLQPKVCQIYQESSNLAPYQTSEHSLKVKNFLSMLSQSRAMNTYQ